jgi:hypothetical protein
MSLHETGLRDSRGSREDFFHRSNTSIRDKWWGGVGQHEHRISDSHRRVHDCAIWPGFAGRQLAIECCADELNQPLSALGE